MEILVRFIREERGATMVEYGLMVALISIATLVAVLAIQGAINDTFNTVVNCIKSTGDVDACTLPNG